MFYFLSAITRQEALPKKRERQRGVAVAGVGEAEGLECKRIGRSWCRTGLSAAGRLRNRASFFLHYESRYGIIAPVFTGLFGTKGLHRESHSRIPFISGKAFTVRP